MLLLGSRKRKTAAPTMLLGFECMIGAIRIFRALRSTDGMQVDHNEQRAHTTQATKEHSYLPLSNTARLTAGRSLSFFRQLLRALLAIRC